MQSKIIFTSFYLILISILIGCSNSTPQFPAPQKIGQNERSRIISGNYLLWLQTFQSFRGELPPRLLNFYPFTSEPAGGRSVKITSANVYL
ncbi:hypothetical protein D1BOALGB6SA_10902 [Olavius sp. associated proteobacterium Delta 1]|nr:hypothetical protein D1BOALGB6SA_10902 [Olavius sp. associated proteobacterium Delta 1]